MAHRRTPEQIETLRLMREQHSNLLKKTIYKDVDTVKKEIQKYHPFKPEDEITSIARDVYEKYKDNPGMYNNVNISTDSLSVAKTLTPFIYNKNWRLISAEAGQHFITSDAPATFYRSNRSPQNPQSYIELSDIAFPITKNLILLMEGHGAKWGYFRAQPGWTAKFNEATARNCQKYIYGPDREYIQKLREKFNLDNSTWTPNLIVGDLDESDAKVYPEGAPIIWRAKTKDEQ